MLFYYQVRENSQAEHATTGARSAAGKDRSTKAP